MSPSLEMPAGNLTFLYVSATNSWSHEKKKTNVIWNDKYNFLQYEYISMQQNQVKNYFENFDDA